jgi:DNA helicase II / ATP-dependent DNA helicase PcrA
MKTPEFEKAYKRLNPEQKKAVDTIEGPVMVIAGPGTGKTQILTLRIANILLQTDVPPEAILALTFTESGVRSMKERLSALIGPDAHRVNIFTFHGLSNYIIQNYPEFFPEVAGSTPISDPEKLSLFEKIFDDSEYKKLKPFGNPYFNVRSVISEISSLKRENILPEVFLAEVLDQQKNINSLEDLTHQKGAHKGKVKKEHKDALLKLEKNIELADIYKKYEKGMRESNFIDYEDMIIQFVSVMEKDEDFKLMLQEEYQYILADEHQDTNQGQNKILEQLSSFHEQPNLFVVGDEKQAIFRFQGASLANFLYFKDIYPEALLISLKDNYRSTQHILDASHSLIGHNTIYDEKLRIQLKSNSESVSKPLGFIEFEEEESEMRYIAGQVKGLLDKDVNQNEIAIIVKENKDTFKVARMMAFFDIPYQNLSTENLLNDILISRLLLILRSVENPLDDAVLSRAIHTNFFDIDPLTTHLVVKASQKNRKHIYEVLKSPEEYLELDEESLTAFKTVIEKYESWIKLAKNDTALLTMSHIVEDSGVVKNILDGENSMIELEKIKQFFTFAQNSLIGKKDPSLTTFLAEVDLMISYDVRIQFSGSESKSGVRIMTAHKSKGREYEYVFVPFARDKYWGGKTKRHMFNIEVGSYINRELSGSVDDERRLFYVALTRAKIHAEVTSSRINPEGREFITSLFIDEIGDEFMEIKEAGDYEKDYIKNPVLITDKKSNPIEKYEEQFLRDIFLERGLSVTALNNYLKCSWRFFYANLLRIPSVYSKQQSFGNAVHYALDRLYRNVQAGGEFDKDSLLKAYEYSLGREILVESTHKELIEKGQEVLGAYYDTYNATFDKEAKTEVSVKGVEIDFEYEGKSHTLQLKGNLDKVERMEGNDYLVTDYKTGKRRTRNEIMGNTKNSDGGYYRQIIFYKLLLNLWKDGEVKMKVGEIIFVQPDDKGKIHSEKFEIEQSEVGELTALIKETSAKIISLNFVDDACGETDCEYCRLAETLS